MRKYALLVASLLALGCAPPTPLPAAPKTDPPAPAGRTLLAFYVIGSDLEDDVNPRNRIPDEQEQGVRSTRGNASQALHALASALAALGPQERANVDVLIGFGGARKQGWDGLRVVDADQLLADDQDGHFGNAGPFALYKPEADMGSVAGLEAFLRLARERAEASPRQVLTFWDHGASYAGLGPDTNTGARLSLAEIRRSLQETGCRADILGFDACHMASLEVLGAIAGHAGYLVASEETEPADGWDLGQLVRYAAANPAASFPAVGRAIVDGYMARPGITRTLSVVDVGAAPALQAALNGLSSRLQGDLAAAYQPMLLAALVSQKFGGFGYGNQELGLDARQWASALNERYPNGPALDLVRALDEAVVYSREGGGHPGASGLMLASPRNIRLMEAGGYGTDNAATLAYWDLLKAVARRADDAATVPDFASDEAVAEGRRVRLAASTGVDEVSAIHALRLPGGGERYELFQRRPLQADADGSYLVPAWDGRALVLDAGSQRVRLPVTMEGPTSGRVALSMDGRPVTLQLGFDAAGEVVSSTLEAIDVQDPANPAPDRQGKPLAPGDVFAVEGQELDWDDRSVKTTPGPNVLVTSQPVFRREAVAGEAVYFAEAADLRDRFRASAPRAAGRAR